MGSTDLRVAASTAQVSTVEGHFIDVPGPVGLSRRLVILRRALGPACRGLIVHAHAFAEEQNKCRRMVAQQSARLAAAGYTVLQIDLLGCGDSDGEFDDATWATWIEDLLAACRWGRSLEPAAPLWLWGTRAGCLLACAAARHLAEPCSMLFWQPVSAGATVLAQFFRLKSAGEMLAQGGKGVVEQLKRELAAGQRIEVAGYVFGAELTLGLSQARLVPSANMARMVWLEVVSLPTGTWTPASTQTLQTWQSSMVWVSAQQVVGPPFWQTVETEDAPALWDATLSAVTETMPAPLSVAAPAEAAP